MNSTSNIPTIEQIDRVIEAITCAQCHHYSKARCRLRTERMGRKSCKVKVRLQWIRKHLIKYPGHNLSLGDDMWFATQERWW
jgi:hypothetical protein